MKISTQQIQTILRGESPAQTKVDAAVIKLTDKDLIQEVVKQVNQMPDRDAMVAELKAKIETGQYKPTGHDIADAMVRRSIADRIKD